MIDFYILLTDYVDFDGMANRTLVVARGAGIVALVLLLHSHKVQRSVDFLHSLGEITRQSLLGPFDRRDAGTLGLARDLNNQNK